VVPGRVRVLVPLAMVDRLPPERRRRCPVDGGDAPPIGLAPWSVSADAGEFVP
jgi:hypothetical protein